MHNLQIDEKYLFDVKKKQYLLLPKVINNKN